MKRSKVCTANCFAYFLIAYIGIAKLAECSAAVKGGHDALRRTKKQVIPGLSANKFPPSSKSEAVKDATQEVRPSNAKGTNETKVVSGHIKTSTDLAAGKPKGHEFLSLAKLAQQRFFDRLDAMDKMIIQNTLPLVGLTAIVPLLQSADLFWVNQLGDTLAVSAQSAANTLYQFSFGLISFLPSVTATLISRNFANNDFEKTENTLFSSLVFGLTASSIISMTLFANPSRYLGAVLKDGNPALDLSVKYMRIRCLSLVPQMITYICFAAFRGMLDYKLCIKFALIASCLDIVLKPLLIHVFRLGLLGSATSTLLCDSFTAVSYMRLIINKGFFARKNLFSFPSWTEVLPLLKGFSLQARSFAMHFTNLIVARKVQSFDDSGVTPAAFSLAMQTFFTGGILIYAMAMSAQTLYPNAIAKCKEEEKEKYTKTLVQRLLGRGLLVGFVITCIQTLLFPLILRTSPVAEVRQAAIIPIIASIALQGINGVVCVGEAIMVGKGKFASASLVLMMASMGYIGCLQLFPQSWGINGVSSSFGIFNLLRLLGLLVFLPSLMNYRTRS